MVAWHSGNALVSIDVTSGPVSTWMGDRLAAYTYSGLMAQADRLDPEVGTHLALCCIYCMNR